MVTSLMLLVCFDLPKIGAQFFSHQSYESAFTAFVHKWGRNCKLPRHGISKSNGRKQLP